MKRLATKIFAIRFFCCSPDEGVFKGYKYRMEHVQKLLWNYVYLNTGLSVYLNGDKYKSDNGLLDLLYVNHIVYIDMIKIAGPIYS